MTYMSNSEVMIRSAVLLAREMISDGRASCVVIKDGSIVRSESASGIAPIVNMYDGGYMRGSVVVDRIVGRAAAQIMVLGGVRECFGCTVSKGALRILEKSGVHTEYDILCDAIINREGNGICPMEAAVENIEDPADALEAVRRRLAELRSGGKRSNNETEI